VIGQRLRYLRQTLNLTQKQLSGRLCIHQSQISVVEKGRGGMSPRTLMLIQNMFGFSYEWLMSGKGPIFSDWGKGIEILNRIGRVNTEGELLFLVELAKHFYSLEPERMVQSDLLRVYLQLIEFLVERVKNLDTLNAGQYLPYPWPDLRGRLASLKKALRSGECKSSLAACVLRELERLLVHGEVDLGTGNINSINQILMPEELWVAKKAMYPTTAPVNLRSTWTGRETRKRRIRIQNKSFSFDGLFEPDPADFPWSLIYSKASISVKFDMDFKSLYELTYVIGGIKDLGTMRVGEWQISKDNTGCLVRFGECFVSWNSDSNTADLKDVVERIRAEEDVYRAIANRYLQEFGTY